MGSKIIGTTVLNGATKYFIISADKEENPSKLLLQRLNDNEIIIAHRPVFTSKDKNNFYWGSGNYFGRDLKAAVEVFNNG